AALTQASRSAILTRKAGDAVRANSERHGHPPVHGHRGPDPAARARSRVVTGGFEFRLLGPLEVRSDGEPLQLGGPKERALLALLLIDAGRAVSTDRLIDALWGERPPATAQTSLQNFVSQLRKHLGPDLVITKPPGY